MVHGACTPSGLWKGPPPGNIGKKDIAVGMASLKEQMANPMFVTKGGGGYGVDETQKVVNDGKGVVLANQTSCGREVMQRWRWGILLAAIFIIFF